MTILGIASIFYYNHFLYPRKHYRNCCLALIQVLVTQFVQEKIIWTGAWQNKTNDMYGCPAWSESALGAHVIVLVFWL